MGPPISCQAPIPPARSYTWVKPAALICSNAVPDRFPLWQYTAYVAALSSAAIRVAKSGASMSMFCAAGRCPLAYSAGVRTSSTIVPGAFMAVEKSLAAICCPVAGEVVPPADLLEEQALTPAVVATATMASAAAAIQRTMIGWGCVRMLPAPCVDQGVSEAGVDSLESEPSAGEVAGVDPFTEQHTGGEVGADTAGAQHAHLAPAGSRGDLIQPLPQFEVGDVEGTVEVALGILRSRPHVQDESRCPVSYTHLRAHETG